MKRFIFLSILILTVSTLSCKEAQKKSSDDATSSTGTSSSSTSYSSISCTMEKESLSKGSVSFSGSTCTFNKASANYKLKVKFSGPSNPRVIITSSTSDMEFSGTSGNSYFYITGTSPANDDFNTVDVLIRDLDACKKSSSSSDCNIHGKHSSPSAKNAKWDQTCSLTIKTNTSSSSDDSSTTSTSASDILSKIGSYAEGIDKILEGISDLVGEDE